MSPGGPRTTLGPILLTAALAGGCGQYASVQDRTAPPVPATSAAPATPLSTAPTLIPAAPAPRPSKSQHHSGPGSRSPSPTTDASPSRSLSARPASRDISAYQGLAAWVDVYDTVAYQDPVGALFQMASHGARTLFLQTGNYRLGPLVHPGEVEQFVQAAHAYHMKVVAWYVPLFRNVDRDLRAVMVALRYRTVDDQGFDGFALDIEKDKVPPGKRIANLLELSARIREAVGPSAAVGAIIPSPRGLIRVPTYWPGFPYRELPRYYDVILPMSYYTFHYKGPGAVYRYITDNVSIVRTATGIPTIPIHVIGGLTEETSPREAAAFVLAVRRGRVLGASLYEYAGTTPAQWAFLAQIR